MRKLYYVVVILLIGLIISISFYNRQNNIKKTEYALDTIITISANGINAKKAVEESFDKIYEAENMLSVYKENSEIAKLNVSKKLEINSKIVDMIRNSYTYSEKTNGNFDITIKPLMDLWDFKNNTSNIPSDDLIKKSLLSVGYKNINIDENIVTLSNDASIDLGGVAKGYCANQVAKIMKDNNVKESIIDLGGNVYVIGDKNFKVGIQNPDGVRGEYFGICNVKNASIVTSGGYERYFVKDDKMYHHILNPYTGICANNGVKSVSIIGENSEKCDAFSTAVFVMGLDDGIDALNKESDLGYIILDNNNNVYKSDNVDFTITNEAFKLK